MTFGFIEAEKASFPISRMCHVLGVSQSGFFAWQERPACRRQQQDSQPPAGNRGGQSGLAAVLDGVWWSGPGLSPGETGDSVGDFLELRVGLLSS